MDTFPPARQRPALLALAAILDTRASLLRRDDCGDWRITGLRGHLYADGRTAFVLCVSTETSGTWTNARAALSAFATVVQDGDTEGALRLDRLPTREEGALIRKVLRIPKRRHLSDDQRDRLVRTGFASTALEAVP